MSTVDFILENFGPVAMHVSDELVQFSLDLVQIICSYTVYSLPKSEKKAQCLISQKKGVRSMAFDRWNNDVWMIPTSSNEYIVSESFRKFYHLMFQPTELVCTAHGNIWMMDNHVGKIHLYDMNQNYRLNVLECRYPIAFAIDKYDQLIVFSIDPRRCQKITIYSALGIKLKSWHLPKEISGSIAVAVTLNQELVIVGNHHILLMTYNGDVIQKWTEYYNWKLQTVAIDRVGQLVLVDTDQRDTKIIVLQTNGKLVTHFSVSVDWNQLSSLNKINLLVDNDNCIWISDTKTIQVFGFL